MKLTKKRERWVKNRDVTIKGTRIAYNAAVQERYVSALERLVLQMSRETKRRVKRLFTSETAGEYFEEQKELEAMDASIASQARILMNYLSRTFEGIFSLKVKSLAETMLKSTAKSSASAVHESLEKLTGGLSLNTSVVTEGQQEVVTALLAENVSLIESIPQQYMKDATGAVMRSITTGDGLADLIPALDKIEGIAGRRAKNIALDQTRKAYAGISRQKLMSNGVKRFEWIHSGGGLNPRDSHIKMDGVIFNFDNIKEQQAALGVPESDRGYPGEPVNCRCTLRSVVVFDNSEEV